MNFFDISKPWVIVSHPANGAEKKSADDLLYCLNQLRKKSGLPQSIIMKDNTVPVDDQSPVIILAAFDHDPQSDNFFWIINDDKIEINGISSIGFTKGIYHFLAALGFSFPSPSSEIIPNPDKEHTSLYRLSGINGKKTTETEPPKRFILPSIFPVKNIDKQLLWGMRNSAGAVIIPPEKIDAGSAKKMSRGTAMILAKISEYGFTLEIGGWKLSCLVPRNRFLFNKELFRMECGERKKQPNFCPTNPDTIRLIQKEARKLFSRFPNVQTFHLWPDKNQETVWCNCPSCRAFSFAEQNIIAVSAAADVLAETRPEAVVSYIELPDEEQTIRPRKNMLGLLLSSIIQEADKA